MKTLLLILLTATGLNAAAAETKSNLVELNAAIDELLAPVRDANTQARIAFKDIQTNDQRALSLQMEAHYKKTGPANFLELRIDNLDYAYGDGTAPRTHIKGYLGTDLTKILPQEQLNRLVPEIENLVGSMAADATRQYGEAAAVKVEVLSRTQDEAGNYVAITARLSVEIDLSKIPQSVKSEDIMISSAVLDISAQVTRGLDIEAQLVSNPGYRGFTRNNEGLKDVLDRLTARDPSTLGELQKFIFDMNELAGRVASGQGF